MLSFWSIFTLVSVLGISAFPSLLFVPIPYGKFTRKGYGPFVQAKWGWIIQEGACLVTAVYILCTSEIIKFESKLLVIVFILYYIYRCIIYGLLMPAHSQTTLCALATGTFFGIPNAYLQAAGLIFYDLPETSINSPRIFIGLSVWLFALCFTVYHDSILRTLRESGDKSYKIPHGGLFSYVSCANYFTEMLVWVGWGIACQNWCGWLLLVLTLANLIPRSLSCHKFYLENMKEYASLNRKAVIPFIL